MKNVSIQTNRAFKFYDASGESIHAILQDHQKVVRFDLSLNDETKHDRIWRASVFNDHANDGDLVLQIKDYEGNKTYIPLEGHLGVSDIAAKALHHVWMVIEGVNTVSLPIVEVLDNDF